MIGLIAFPAHKSAEIVKTWVRRINQQSLVLEYLEVQAKIKKGTKLCYRDILVIQFRIQGLFLNLDSICKDLMEAGTFNKKACDALQKDHTKKLLLKVCKKNSDCLSKVVAFIAAELLPLAITKFKEQPVPIRRDYTNKYIGIAYLMARSGGIMCEDTFVDNCEKDNVIDSMVQKKAQKFIETYTLGGDVKANCPPALKAATLPSKTEIMMALNSGRAVLGGKEIAKMDKPSMEGTQEMSTTVPWVFFYVPFMTKELDPYIEYL